MAARTGASTKDRWPGWGTTNMRAALIYRHATAEADRQIADRLSDLLDEHKTTRPDGDDGAAGSLVPVG